MASCISALRPAPLRRVPDLGVALEADPELLEDQNGYIVEDQGKPLDFVLEIASKRTWRTDVEDKVQFYAELGIGEYWRLDRTGCHYGYKLAGDSLVDGIYLPIPIEVVSDKEERGYSHALGLYVCWKDGRLDWYDPVAEDYIPSLESLLELAAQESQRADEEARLRRQEQRRAESLERRVRELERRLNKLER